MEGRVLPRPNFPHHHSTEFSTKSFNGGSGITPTESRRIAERTAKRMELQWRVGYYPDRISAFDIEAELKKLASMEGRVLPRPNEDRGERAPRLPEASMEGRVLPRPNA